MNVHSVLPYSPVSAIQADLQALCGTYEIVPAARDGWISGQTQPIAFQRLRAVQVELSACSVIRDRRSTRRDPGDHLFLLYQTQGESRIHQNERERHLRKGDMCLVDSTRSSEFLLERNGSSILSVHLARDEFVHSYGEECISQLHVIESDPLQRAISVTLDKMQEAQPDAVGALEDALLSLIGAHLLDGASLGAYGGCQSATLSKAIQLIERHYRNPDYGPAELADDLCVSQRTLQRHFVRLKETPRQRLLDLRLQHAYRQLSRGEKSNNPNGIADVAFGAGFNDLSYFYRKFRTKYGKTPGEVVKCKSVVRVQ